MRTRAPRLERAERRRPAVAPEIDALADRVGRLRPCRHDYEAFHVEKDEIERALRRLARQGQWASAFDPSRILGKLAFRYPR